MAAALEALASVSADGHRVAVLGEMLELGAHSDEEHATVGRLAAGAGVDLLVVVGSGASPLAVAARASGLADVIEAPDAPRRARRARPAAWVRATRCWSRAAAPSGSTLVVRGLAGAEVTS